MSQGHIISIEEDREKQILYMAAYAHGTENVHEVVDVEAVEDRREDPSLPHTRLYTEPTTGCIAPAYLTLKIRVPHDNDIDKKKRDFPLQ